MKIILIIVLLSLVSVINSFANENWTVKPFERKAFIENKGQLNSHLTSQYKNFDYCIDNSSQILFNKQGLTYVIKKTNYKKLGLLAVFMTEAKREAIVQEIDTKVQFVTMTWLGANFNVTLEANNLQATSYNYGMCTEEGKPFTTMCKGYSKITYKNLYNGIDVEYFFNQKQGFKYNLIVSKGADISQVKMQYNNTAQLIVKQGNINIKTIMGDIVDHAPVTFMSGNNHDTLPSRYSVEKNIVSFVVDNPTKSSFIIDPWTITPQSATGTNVAVENGVDAAGNVYVAGGGNAISIIEKFSPSNILLWSYTDTSFAAYGDMLVEANGNFYLGDAVKLNGARVSKHSPTSSFIWYSNTESSYTEFWRLAYNCASNKLIVAGGGVFNPPKNIAEVDMSTGVLSNPQSFFLMDNHDISGLCVDDNGNAYCHDAMSNQLIFANTTNALLGYASSYYLHREAKAYNPKMLNYNGYNMMTTGANAFLFTTDGYALKKWNKTTRTLVDSVLIPGGVELASCGILADNCNNLYVGSNLGVYRYNFNLLQKEFQPTSGVVYDIAYGNNGNVIACGDGFLSSLPFKSDTCSGRLKTTLITDSCNSSINTVKVTPVAGTPPFTFLWNDGNTDSIRVNLPAGKYTVTVRGGLCTPTFIRDTIEIKGTKGIAVTSHPPCFLGANGKITIELKGQKIVSYTSMPAATINSINDSTIIAINLSNGSYSFHISTTNGCSIDSTIKLTQYSTITSATIATRIATCTTPPTGAGKVYAVMGGKPYTASGKATYTYSWNVVPTQTDTIIKGVPAGKYIVTITDSIGCTKLDSVIILSSPIPIAAFSSSSVCFNASTTFADATTLAIGNIKTWAWIFGGTATLPVPTSSVQNPIFKYDKCNNAANNATLIVTSDSGCVATLTKPVIVHCLPIPNFTFSNGCEKDDRIKFSNTSANGAGTGGVLISKWRLGLSPLQIVALNPSQIYNAPGNYNINLSITDQYGCIKDTAKPLVIYPKPNANFVVDSVCLNIANTLTNTSTLSVPAGFTDAVSNYNWTYNYTNTYTANATTASTSHIYTLPATQAMPT
ncbi:MAG: hypothetical protein H7331_01940, partial [Bacteroidia bacterium]|nr:hypothetical protein [Bacteroidia bacterium]